MASFRLNALSTASIMDNSQPLFWYGLLVLVVTGSLILMPNLRSRASLISGWNMMLLGVAIFTGLGCLEAATSPIIRFPGLSWFQPTKDEVTWFMTSSTIFLVAMIATYYYNPLSSLTRRVFRKMPVDTTPMYLWVIGLCLLNVLLVPLTLNLVFIGRVTLHLSHKAIIFGAVFSFMLWMRQRFNLAWFALFVAAFLSALMLAIIAGPTRRLFLSVFLAPVACIYIISIRHWRPTRALVAIGIAFVALLALQFMYNQFRRFSGADPSRGRTAANILEEVKRVDTSWMQRLSEDTFRMMAQSNVQYSLYTQRHVETGLLEAKPLNTLIYLASYPIPRQFWPEKPSIIGVTITHEVVGAQRTNWGVNVVGHTAYEGGLWVAALYGFLAAIGLRFLDDPLQRQYTNPFLIGIFVAAAPHILGWARGDLGVMTTETAECFLFAIILAISARVLFGTDKTTQGARVLLPRAKPFQQSFAR